MVPADDSNVDRSRQAYLRSKLVCEEMDREAQQRQQLARRDEGAKEHVSKPDCTLKAKRAVWPPFFFRAQEIRPIRTTSQVLDQSGRWQPPKKRCPCHLSPSSDNYKQYWACNGQQVQPVQQQTMYSLGTGNNALSRSFYSNRYRPGFRFGRLPTTESRRRDSEENKLRGQSLQAILDLFLENSKTQRSFQQGRIHDQLISEPNEMKQARHLSSDTQWIGGSHKQKSTSMIIADGTRNIEIDDGRATLLRTLGGQDIAIEIFQAAALSFAVQRLSRLSHHFDNVCSVLFEDQPSLSFCLLGWLFLFFFSGILFFRTRERAADQLRSQFLIAACLGGLAHAYLAQATIPKLCLQILPPWIALGLMLSWIVHRLVNTMLRGVPTKEEKQEQSQLGQQGCCDTDDSEKKDLQY